MAAIYRLPGGVSDGSAGRSLTLRTVQLPSRHSSMLKPQRLVTESRLTPVHGP
jgi:hypothetical protein